MANVIFVKRSKFWRNTTSVEDVKRALGAVAPQVAKEFRRTKTAAAKVLTMTRPAVWRATSPSHLLEQIKVYLLQDPPPLALVVV